MEYIWSITGKCDMNCKYCWDPYKQTKQLSYEECCTKIDELLNSGCSMLIFTGGEPTVHENFFDIVQYAHNRGISELKVCTNGFNLPRNTDRLIASAISEIHISINEAAAIENRTDVNEYKDALCLLKNAGKKIVFVSIIDIHNLQNYISVLELAEKLDVKVIFQFMAKPADKNIICLCDLDEDVKGRLFSDIEEIHKKYKKVVELFAFSYYDVAKRYYLYGERPKFCYADQKYRIISPDGCIRPCYWKQENDCSLEDCFSDKCLVWFRYNKRIEQIYKMMKSEN